MLSLMQLSINSLHELDLIRILDHVSDLVDLFYQQYLDPVPPKNEISNKNNCTLFDFVQPICPQKCLINETCEIDQKYSESDKLEWIKSWYFQIAQLVEYLKQRNREKKSNGRDFVYYSPVSTENISETTIDFDFVFPSCLPRPMLLLRMQFKVQPTKMELDPERTVKTESHSNEIFVQFKPNQLFEMENRKSPFTTQLYAELSIVNMNHFNRSKRSKASFVFIFLAHEMIEGLFDLTKERNWKKRRRKT